MDENSFEKYNQLLIRYNALKVRYEKLEKKYFHTSTTLQNLGYGNLENVNTSLIDDEFLCRDIKNIYEQLQELTHLREQKCSKLDISDWDSWCESSVYDLYPILRGGLFHCTSIPGLVGIQKDGYIIPNDGRFSRKYPQTEHYYGYSQGYTSLFDFSSGTDEERISIHTTWAPFFSDYKPVTIVLKLDRDWLDAKLIPNSAGPKSKEENYKGYIPYLEAWYPEPIPLSAVELYIVTCDHPEIVSKLLFFEYDKDQVFALNQVLKELELDSE